MAAHTGSSELPIRKFKKEILRVVEKTLSLVIVGQTGSGKTTQLPKYLHRSGKQIVPGAKSAST